jgi:hypothetical protein
MALVFRLWTLLPTTWQTCTKTYYLTNTIYHDKPSRLSEMPRECRLLVWNLSLSLSLWCSHPSASSGKEFFFFFSLSHTQRERERERESLRVFSALFLLCFTGEPSLFLPLAFKRQAFISSWHAFFFFFLSTPYSTFQRLQFNWVRS